MEGLGAARPSADLTDSIGGHRLSIEMSFFDSGKMATVTMDREGVRRSLRRTGSQASKKRYGDRAKNPLGVAPQRAITSARDLFGTSTFGPRAIQMTSNSINPQNEDGAE
jgi:hypothetical protein